MNLTTAQLDRACGVLLATAAGDTLGAPYEFKPPRSPELTVAMTGGGSFGWEPGEWTDDTSMAVAIAEVAATGADLRDQSAQDAIVTRWAGWARTAKDVGNQTRAVLSAVDPAAPAESASVAAVRLHERTGRSAGNGSLMRTAPVALAYLDDEAALVEAATALSALTHADLEAGEACILWCLAIRHAVLTSEMNIRRGLERLTSDRASMWADRLDEAEAKRPSDFPKNGWVVHALQAAWSAIAGTPVPVDGRAGDLNGVFRADRLRLALDAAVRCGHDTDTVAAIAGGLLGAVHGASAVPATWRRVLHGWPGLRSRDLVALATAVVHGGAKDRFDYSYAGYGDLSASAVHPYDAAVRLGAIGALRPLDPDVDAVVSLCRVGDDDVPAGIEHIEVRLIDRDRADENPNLGFVLRDTVEILCELRAAGKTVLLHCVQAQSRTPTVAALYGASVMGLPPDTIFAGVQVVLPGARPIARFRGTPRPSITGSSQSTV